jgi:hypothetical protein
MVLVLLLVAGTGCALIYLPAARTMLATVLATLLIVWILMRIRPIVAVFVNLEESYEQR